MSVNVKIEAATFKLNNNKLTVNGSFITELHLAALVGGEKRKWSNLSFWGSQLDENNWGWEVITGYCGGRRFRFGKGGHRACEDLNVAMSMASATFSAKYWTINVKGARTYASMGPLHRVDIGFVLRGDYAARHLPHGIVGQSFSSALPRHGRVDVYPPEGHFTTSAQAEGAIEGEASMYEVGSPFETRFKFSRFDASPRQSPLSELLAERDREAEASAADGVGAAW